MAGSCRCVVGIVAMKTALCVEAKENHGSVIFSEQVKYAVDFWANFP
jgi:hypothetical protein